MSREEVSPDKILLTMRLRDRISEFLRSTVADQGTQIETSSDGVSCDCRVTVDGHHYYVSVDPRNVDAVIDQFETEMTEAARDWAALLPDVLTALRASGQGDLAERLSNQSGPFGDRSTSH